MEEMVFFLNLTSLSGVDSLLSFAASSDIGRKLLRDFMSFNTFNMIILLLAWKKENKMFKHRIVNIFLPNIFNLCIVLSK